MQTPTQRPLRHSVEWITALVAQNHAAEQGVARKRTSPRFDYLGSRAALEVPQTAGPPIRYAVVTRDLSREGACFVIGKFLYPGATIVVNLKTVHNRWEALGARIMRCSYIPGTPMLHEIGVRFAEPIDIELFHRGARHIDVLLYDEEGTTTRLFSTLLKTQNATVRPATCFDTFRATVTQRRHHLFVVDVDTPGGAETCEKLINEHFGGAPLIALTSSHDEAEHAHLLNLGCTSVMTKPFSGEDLKTMIERHVCEPLISTLAADADLADLVNEFVASLPQRTAAIRTGLASSSTDDLREIIRRLQADAASFGFPTLASAARRLHGMLEQGTELAALRNGFGEVITLCHAVRPVGRQGTG